MQDGPGPLHHQPAYEKSLIAGRLGMRPESLSRAFADLEKAGVLLEDNRVTVTDIEGLEDFCQQAPKRRSRSPER